MAVEHVEVPQALYGLSGEAFQGNPKTWLQTLLPVDPAFDMAVNLFTFQPGAPLPQVEPR